MLKIIVTFCYYLSFQILYNSTQKQTWFFNSLNAELNPICHLLALLGAQPILHISRIMVN